MKSKKSGENKPQGNAEATKPQKLHGHLRVSLCSCLSKSSTNPGCEGSKICDMDVRSLTSSPSTKTVAMTDCKDLFF